MLENFVMDDQIQINVEAELLTPFQGGPSIYDGNEEARE